MTQVRVHVWGLMIQALRLQAFGLCFNDFALCAFSSGVVSGVGKCSVLGLCCQHVKILSSVLQRFCTFGRFDQSLENVLLQQSENTHIWLKVLYEH